MFGCVPLHMPSACCYPSMISRLHLRKMNVKQSMEKKRNVTNFTTSSTFTLDTSLGKKVLLEIEFSLQDIVESKSFLAVKLVELNHIPVMKHSRTYVLVPNKKSGAKSPIK